MATQGSEPVATAAGAAAAATLYQANHGDTADVIIVGAGVAGLGAAQRLMRSPSTQHLRVVVLEAGSQVGGRLRADRTFFKDGTPLDVGAELVHGADNEMVHLAQAAGTQLHELFTWSQGDGGPSEEPAPDGSVGYYWLPSEKRMARYNDLPEEVEHMHRILEESGDVAQSMFDSPEALATARNLKAGGQGTVSHHLASEGIKGDALALAVSGFGNTTGGNLEELSFERIGSFERAWGKDGEGADFRMVGGYTAFLRWISSGVAVALDTAVSAIQTDDDDDACEYPVSVSFERQHAPSVAGDIACRTEVASAPPVGQVVHAAGGTLRCKRVIVTIPPPALRSGFVRFTPPLSVERTAALNRIQLRNGIKVALKFKSRVWPADCMGLVSGGTIFPEMWMNHVDGVGAEVAPPTVAPHAQGLQPLADALRAGQLPAGTARCSKAGFPTEDAPFLVIGFAMGPFADALLRLPPAEIVRRMLQQLATMFQDHVPNSAIAFSSAFVMGRVYSWALDKWVQGAYTCPSLLEHPGDRAELAKPHAEGRVLFAGEAVSGANEASDSPLTLHGALRTGLQAAGELAAGLGGEGGGSAAAKL